MWDKALSQFANFVSKGKGSSPESDVNESDVNDSSKFQTAKPVSRPVQTPIRRRKGIQGAAAYSAHSLDISMINGQLMCMGMPWNLPTKKDSNKNNINEIVTFLENRFQDHYLVFNLTDVQYDDYKFNYQVLNGLIGIRKSDNDKIRTPTLEELFNICYAIQFWCSLHPKNMAVLHCKNGKSCTRLVVAAYMMFDGTCSGPDEALALFYRKRLRRPGFKIANLPQLVPSARGALGAFSSICNSNLGSIVKLTPLILKNLVMMDFPCDFTDQPAPIIELWRGNRQLFTSQGVNRGDERNEHAKLQWNEKSGDLVLQLACEVQGDILLVCRAIVDIGTEQEPKDEERIVFQYSFHTSFLASGALPLGREEIDIIGRSRKDQFTEKFKLDLFFTTLQADKTTSSSKPSHLDRISTVTQNSRLGLRDDQAREAGLVWITQKHTMQPHEDVFRKLQNEHPCRPELAIFACQRMINDYNRCVNLIQDFGDLASVTTAGQKSNQGGKNERNSDRRLSSSDRAVSAATRPSAQTSSSDSALNNQPMSVNSPFLHPSLITPDTSNRSSSSLNQSRSHWPDQGRAGGLGSTHQNSRDDVADPRWRHMLEPFQSQGWDMNAPFVILIFEILPPDGHRVSYKIVHGEGSSSTSCRIWSQGHVGFIYKTDGKNAWDVVYQMPGQSSKQFMAMMRTESKLKEYRYFSFKHIPCLRRHYLRKLKPDQIRILRRNTNFQEPLGLNNFMKNSQFLFYDRNRDKLYRYKPKASGDTKNATWSIPQKHSFALRTVKDMSWNKALLDKLIPRVSSDVASSVRNGLNMIQEPPKSAAQTESIARIVDWRSSRYARSTYGIDDREVESQEHSEKERRRSIIGDNLRAQYDVPTPEFKSDEKHPNSRDTTGQLDVLPTAPAIPRSVLKPMYDASPRGKSKSNMEENFEYDEDSHHATKESQHPTEVAFGQNRTSVGVKGGGLFDHDVYPTGLAEPLSAENDAGFFDSSEVRAGANHGRDGGGRAGGSGVGESVSVVEVAGGTNTRSQTINAAEAGPGPGAGGSNDYLPQVSNLDRQVVESENTGHKTSLEELKFRLKAMEKRAILAESALGGTKDSFIKESNLIKNHGQANQSEAPQQETSLKELQSLLKAMEKRAAIAESALAFMPLASGENALETKKKLYEAMLLSGESKRTVREKMVEDGISGKDADDFLLSMDKKKDQEGVKESKEKVLKTAELEEKLNSKGESESSGNESNTAIENDPKYQPYLKMLKMGVPPPAVKQKMVKDGVDPAILDMDPTKPPSFTKTNDVDKGPAIQDDPKYQPYLKMLKMGIPPPAVKHKMVKDGINPDILDMDPTKPPVASEKSQYADGPAIKDDPTFRPYLKMLKMGVPPPAVKQKMIKDGLDPGILDMDFAKPPLVRSGTLAPAKKPRRKRRQTKKLHWDALPEDRLHSNTIWASETNGIGGTEDGSDKMVFGAEIMSEMESLFVKSNDTPSPRSRHRKRLLGKRQGTKSGDKSKGKVSIIEPKRARNVAITLARIKIPFEDLRDGLRFMNLPDLSTEQLGVLQTVLPTEPEQRAVRAFSGDISRLQPCDRFFKIISDVENASDRLECMLCVRQFPLHVDELLAKVDCISRTCDEIRLSPTLKIVLEVALKIGNQLNRLEHGTTTEDSSAVGGIRAFSLRSLVKLSQTKSYDKKTTVLHVIAKYSMLKKDEIAKSQDSSEEKGVSASENFAAIVEDRTKLLSLEMPHLEMAKRIPIPVLKQEGIRLRRSLQKILNELRGAPIMDPVWGPIRAFAAQARSQLESVDQRISKANADYEELVNFFAEDPDLRNEEFFSILHSFADSFKKALLYNEKVEADARRRARLKKEEEEKKAKREARRRKKELATKSAELSSQDESETSTLSKSGSSAAVPKERAGGRKSKPVSSPERNEYGRKLTPREQLLKAITQRKDS